MERAILVTIDPNPFSLLELENLAAALDIDCVYKIKQNIDKPTTAFYIGSGKVQEIKTAIQTTEATIVLFDDELKPTQIRNLEKLLEITIMDRTFLVLEIFARRAKSRQSILEIELARSKYMLPRLVGMRSSLSRQGGGNYAKGAGEKKLELDRRKILSKISHLENELSIVNSQKENQRKKRKKDDIKVVALVGYTNAGKSATMNSLLGDAGDNRVFEKDMLFATLDTFVRRIKTNLNQEFLLIDTIGFVSKLPSHLINSFKSTLDEALDADLLVHIVDATDPEFPTHIMVTNEVLKGLGADKIEMIYGFSKADLLEEQFFPEFPNAVLYSNKTSQNVDLLLDRIENLLFQIVAKQFLFPYNCSKEFTSLETCSKITKKRFADEGIYANALIDVSKLENFKNFIKN